MKHEVDTANIGPTPDVVDVPALGRMIRYADLANHKRFVQICTDLQLADEAHAETLIAMMLHRCANESGAPLDSYHFQEPLIGLFSATKSPVLRQYFARHLDDYADHERDLLFMAGMTEYEDAKLKELYQAFDEAEHCDEYSGEGGTMLLNGLFARLCILIDRIAKYGTEKGLNLLRDLYPKAIEVRNRCRKPKGNWMYMALTTTDFKNAIEHMEARLTTAG